MSKPLYAPYYRRFGVRRYSELQSPRLQLIQFLQLPKYSIYHYLTDDPSLLGPSETDYLLSRDDSQLWVEFVPDIAAKRGSPRRKPGFQINSIALAYRAQNKRVRILKDITSVEKSATAQIIENYAPLNDAYIYRTNLTARYDRWWNMAATVWNQVNSVAERSERQQFVVINLPTSLPKLSQLRNAVMNPSRTTLLPFQTQESLYFLDFFRYLGPDRETAAMGVLTEKAISKLNIIFTDGNFFTVLSMELMEAWREALKKGETFTLAQLQSYQKHWLMLTQRLWMQGQDEATGEQEDADWKEDTADTDLDDPEYYSEVDEYVTPKESDNEDLYSGVDVPVEAEVGEADASAGDEDDDDFIPIGGEEYIPQKQTIRQAPGIEFDVDSAEATELDDSLFEPTPETPVVSPQERLAETAAVITAPPKEETHEDYVEALSGTVIEKANALADAGQLSGVQYKAAMKNAGAIHDIPAPDGSDASLAEFIEVTEEQAKVQPKQILPDDDTIVDKSMLASSMATLDATYVEKVMHKDVAAAVVAIQQAGIAVTGYSVEEVTDVMGNYQVVTIKLAPVGGTPSTFQVKIPKVEKNGAYKVNGVKYRMRKQRVDLPIRKIGIDQVALSTEYGKVFISRSERVANDSGKWLMRNLQLLSRQPDSKLTSLMRGNVFLQTDKTPFWYSELAMNFTSAVYDGWNMQFNTETVAKMFDETTLALFTARGMLPFAKNEAGEILAMNKDSLLYVFVDSGSEPQPAGSVPEFFGLDITKMPIESTDLEFFGIRIPIGVVLAYYMGLTNLLSAIKAKYRIVARGSKMNLLPDEYAISFDDEHLILSKDDRYVSLIMGGFLDYKHYLNYSRGLFDAQDIYFNVLDAAGLKVRHLKELDLMRQLFIDPISRKILISMHEPTDFVQLLNRAVELLMTNHAPRVNQLDQQRFKGYEKVAGLLYREMVDAVRSNANNPQGHRQAITISPVSIWNEMLDDKGSILVEETNPMIEIKQSEEATFSGTGGRSKRAMTKPTRAYDPTDLGTVSEGTKDSGDVGISAYLAPNANITNVYGMTRPFNPETDGPSSVLSTSVLAVPAADRDSAPRMMFIGIQQNQMIAAEGYDVQPWRTGGEAMIAQRAAEISNNFAGVAQHNGTVTKVNKRLIEVTYDTEDKASEIFELGTVIGKGPGAYYPHEIITDMKVGDTVHERDVVCWHKWYYKRDWWNPGQVLWRSGVLSLVGILDIPETHEDSSYVFERTTQLFKTKAAKPRVITVDARMNVRGLVKVGMQVDPRTILATIEEPLASDLSGEDQEAVESLRLMSQFNPRADVRGEVIQIDVLYRADVEDMSETLAQIVTDADKQRAKRVKELKLDEALTGRVSGNTRIEGEPLGQGQIAIVIYTQYTDGAGMGDKGTMSSQMKSVISDVGHGVNKTEDGRELDAIFSGTSIANRIVTSPEVVGSTNLFLLYATEEAVDIYFN